MLPNAVKMLVNFFLTFVLKALKGANLQLDIDKCEFYKTEVLYLKLVILINSIQIDLKKIKAIMNW